MQPKVYVQPGGEKWLKWAKRKVALLTDLRLDMRIPVIRKFYVPESGARIDLVSSEFGDWIRIFSSTEGGFIVYPSVVKLTAPFTVFSYYSDQELMPVKNTAILSFPVYTSISMKYRRSSQTLTEGATSHIRTTEEYIALFGQAAWDAAKISLGFTDDQLTAYLNSLLGPAVQLGYFRKQVFLEVNQPTLSTAYMPFTHSYVVGDSTLEKILFLQPHVNNPSVYESGVAAALSSSGSATYSIDDISPSGRIGVGLSGDTRTRYDIDYAAATPVVKSSETLSGYGASSSSYTYSFVGGGNPTDDQSASIIESTDVTYPVCFGFSSANELQQISIHEVSNSSGNHHNLETSPDGGFHITCTGSGAASKTATKTLVLPNGVSKEFLTHSSSISFSGSAFFDFTNHANDNGSGSTSLSQVLGELEILYADASLPAVVYRYTKRTYNSVSSAVFSGSSLAFTDNTATMQVDVSVRLLIGNSDVEIDTSSTSVATDSADDYIDAIPVLITIAKTSIAQLPAGYSPASGTTNTTTPLNTNTSTVVAKKQVSPISIAIQDHSHYVGQYTRSDDSTVIFGNGSPRQALIDRITSFLEAKESADPPTITAEEILLLAAIRAGTLDNYAFKLEKASPFGISLI